MVELINQILSKDVEEVISSPLSLSLIKCYSVLYCGGQQVRVCAVSQRGYYQQLKINGLKKAMEQQDKTCKLANDDLYYIRAIGGHLSNSNITDETALMCLKNGWLKEKHFEKLPDAYLNAQQEEQTVSDIEQATDETVLITEEQNVSGPKKRGPKPRQN